MPSYPVHTIEAAPAASRPLLEQAQAAYGVVPNLQAVLSSAPPVLEACLTLQKLLATSSLSPVEPPVVLGIAFKTLSNRTNHLTGTPRDAMVEATRWSAGDGVADD